MSHEFWQGFLEGLNPTTSYRLIRDDPEFRLVALATICGACLVTAAWLAVTGYWG